MTVQGFNAASYGAVLLGGLMAFSFSGIVAVQSMVYFKMYPRDLGSLKALVSVVWILDLLHSAFIGTALFHYFIKSWGVDTAIDNIHWSVALSVVVTALQTVIAHCFFAHKIYRSSQRNLFLTIPILILAFCRLVAASATTGEMITVKHFSIFTHTFPGWIFTTGLTLSSATDILVALCLFFLLQSMRKRIGTDSSVMIKVVDTLTLYTLETGALTCVCTTASLICWLTMPSNIVFLGLHFVIAKLYANSLLASLNTRKQLREMGPRFSPWADLPILSAEDFGSTEVRSVSPRNRDSLASLLTSEHDRFTRPTAINNKPRQPLEVSVQRVVTRTSQELPELAQARIRLSRSPTILRWQQRHPEYGTP
ncbi:hypothetical protein K435DRAFT_963845 [Dendrothele bispora CBS 962.96]|uniref:DUF6534 domain-containing protein n=1 Tax=Dendrothele bispora (strain CBS 962.96) TaxID=1314807 RepID=A0A4S8MDY9_DENBC|nr:hypothetical protein K435DRAFT_963845 [Dendrothele bispora CBS 962.96]